MLWTGDILQLGGGGAESFEGFEGGNIEGISVRFIQIFTRILIFTFLNILEVFVNPSF